MGWMTMAHMGLFENAAPQIQWFIIFFLYSKSPGGIPPFLDRPARASKGGHGPITDWSQYIKSSLVLVAVPFQRYHSFLAVSCAGPIFPRTKYDRHHSLVDIHQSCSNLLETIGFSGYIPHF